ncbi:MAG: 1-acyl-sn-glycerol-3-phosphate acyltransferase, partial [Myxococcales bacterium]|nr:1-acyl-sn-glycerol-3-phosphate acyltransferase [Myxococcales bacterium]
TRVIPVGLNALFNAQSLKGLLSQFQRLEDRIIIRGDVERLRALAKIGTLVFVPTHSSHMDSLLLGWALEQSGLPPVTYGAGKNMFRRPLTAFFLRNLGAYKVDRRLRHSLYKDVLKQVSQLFLEMGFHSLFFPGGTRTRSGRVEQHLKLGLMGSALTAYTQSLIEGRPQQVFVVPVTINYHLVLEAETLVGDYLRTDGRQRYIIDEDEFSDLGKVTRFALNTMGMDNPLCINFAPPMDCFGNDVDRDGISHDRQGRAVDPTTYVLRNGSAIHDDARDREYVRFLGERVADRFLKANVVFSIHVVARAIFALLKFRHGRWDLYNTIRFGRGEFVGFEELQAWVERLMTLLRVDADAGNVELGALVERASATQLIDEACRYFTMYHSSPLIVRRGKGIELNNLSLLFYYSNRVRGYDYERRLEEQR